jgi:hypothetical protein
LVVSRFLKAYYSSIHPLILFMNSLLSKGLIFFSFDVRIFYAELSPLNVLDIFLLDSDIRFSFIDFYNINYSSYF